MPWTETEVMQDGHYANSWGTAGMHPMGAYGMGGYGCQYWMAAQAYCMVGYAAGLSGYGYAGSYASPAASSTSPAMRSSAPSAAGKKGDYRNLLEEMKARQALREEHRRLRERLAACEGAAGAEDRRERSALQSQLSALERELWLLGEPGVGGTGGSSGSSAGAAPLLRPPEDGRADQFGRLCHALAEALRQHGGRARPLGELEAEGKVRREWGDLLRSRVVTEATRLEDLVAARPGLFELLGDARGRPAVRLVGEAEPQDAPGGDAAGATAATGAVPAGSGAGLAAHVATLATGGAGASRELRGLEQLLQHLSTARDAVGSTMAFCIENGPRHAAPFARALIRALEEPDLKTDAVLARLFLVSDVLYNSHASVRGASRYHTSFQDLLPDASERLGRQWLQRMEGGRLERVRAESAVRRVLGAWQEWAVFPPLFCRGLEALLFAPIEPVAPPETTGSKAEALKHKLARWCSSGAAAHLPYAARLRGLSGPALPTVACRARLCHYENYWHSFGVEDPEVDGCSEDLHQAGSSWLDAASHVQAGADSNTDLSEDSIDGEPLSDIDMEAEAEAAATAPPVDVADGGTNAAACPEEVPEAKRRRTGTGCAVAAAAAAAVGEDGDAVA